MTTKEFLDILIDIRKEKGKKQEDVARYLGVTKTTMSRYESGKRFIPSELLLKYVEYVDHKITLVRL